MRLIYNYLFYILLFTLLSLSPALFSYQYGTIKRNKTKIINKKRKIIKTLPKGTKVRIIKSLKKHYKIDQPVKGYVHKKNIQLKKTAIQERALKRKKQKEIFKQPEKWKVQLKLNTKKTFEKVKPYDAYVFMIGNDNYKRMSDFTKLRQCYNDVRLLKQIFINCVKIKPDRIFAHRDLTIDQFRDYFKGFVDKIKALDKDGKSQIIITYSGHGSEDGSLVFVEGGMLKPIELKTLINSFKNDSVLLIDACYSGNNEGPREMLKKNKKGFKSNSLRIYASLAHLTAKEIEYNNVFFSHLMPFYRDVLGLKEIKGNGYFTAMIGLFFAEYQFKEDENISFKDLVSYITNKGKQYVEYLAIRGKQKRSKRTESVIRLNQQPKILPIKEKPNFNDENHKNILIQKYIEPDGLQVGLSLGLFIPMGEQADRYKSPAFYTNIYLDYELDFITDRLFCGFNLVYLNLTSKPSTNNRDVNLNVLIPAISIKYYPFKASFFSMLIGADFGCAISFINYGSIGPIKEESKTFADFYCDVEISFDFELLKNFYLTVPSKFMYIDYQDEPLYGLSFGIGARYYF